MRSNVLPILDESQPRTAVRWIPEPYLHVGPERIYNPLTDAFLELEQQGFAALRSLLEERCELEDLAPEEREELRSGGWVVPEDGDLGGRYLLKYVSLEASTVCNQACYFCPVSIDPRKSYFMPTELYKSILRQLSAHRETIQAVFMINYNEPTADKRFVEQVGAIREAGLPPAVLTNGSGLTPDRVDRIIALGGLRYFSVNLSTLDRERYAADRGVDQLPLVLRNLEYVKDRELAPAMEIVVLGTGDDVHRRDFEEIRERFAGSRFEVKTYEVMDRAGRLPVGLQPAPEGRLCGCENTGSRPLQHLHITPHGKCVLCCEDYDERYVVGDLTRSSVEEVLTGPEMRRLRRWAYGLEESPDDFLCKKCIYALKR